MALNEYFQVLRRRRVVVLAGVVVGFAAGYMTAPGEGVEPRDYAATTTLVANPSSGTTANLEQAALLVTTGAVPRESAERLGLEDSDAAAKDVTAIADIEVGSITITAVDTDPDRAERKATVFGQQLIAELTEGDLTSYEDSLDRAEQRITELQAKLFPFNIVIGSDDTPDPADIAERDAIERDLGVAQEALNQLRSQGAPKPVLATVENGSAKVVDPPGVEPPDGKVQRGLVLAVLGLGFGVGSAIALDRLDTKIRSKSTAEHAFGKPVVTEVPPLPGGRRSRDELYAVTRPASPVMEAYRGLRTVLTLVHPAASTNGENGHTPEKHGCVVVVASGAAGEGKTTTSAHLGAVLAEVGHSVLVVSADFRRPRLHQFFDVPRDPGLTEALTADEVSLRDMLLDTPVPGVRILASGAPARNPAPLMKRTVDLLLAARRVFDYVIVDTAPLLVANDASELIRASDAVILMCRIGRTSIDGAQRASELMTRIGAPVLGVVLVGGSESSSGYYYRYRYYGEGQERRRVLPGSRRSKAETSASEPHRP